MNYRTATQGDIPQLVVMRFLYLLEHFGSLSDSQRETIDTQLRDYFIRCLNHTVYAYVGEEDGKLISTVLMTIAEKPANPHFITGKTGTLLNVYTRPEYRRQGIAGKLIEQALTDAKEMNLSYVELMATKEGYPLYKKMGFLEQQSESTPMIYTIQ